MICRYCDDTAIVGSDRCGHHFNARTIPPYKPNPTVRALFQAQEAAKDLALRVDMLTPSPEVIEAIRDACSSHEYSPCMSHSEIQRAKGRMNQVHDWLHKVETVRAGSVDGRIVIWKTSPPNATLTIRPDKEEAP